jgi:hypothetical protein
MINNYYISKILFDTENYDHDIKNIVDLTYFLTINMIIIKLIYDMIPIKYDIYPNINYNDILNNFTTYIFKKEYINCDEFYEIQLPDIIVDRFEYMDNIMNQLYIPVLTKYYNEYIYSNTNYYFNNYLNIDFLNINIIIDFDIHLLNNINIIYDKENESLNISENIYLFIKSYIKYINLDENKNIKFNLLKFYINRIFSDININKLTNLFDYIILIFVENYK